MARPTDLPSAEQLAADKPHGVRVKYMAGCRCLKCRQANALYAQRRAKAKVWGKTNAIVPAARARRHIRRLQRAGVGTYRIASVSGVSRSIIGGLIRGERLNLREQTERKLLAVTRADLAEHQVVDARGTWRRIGELLEQGFTKRRIALELGAKTPALQLRRDRVLKRTADAVDRLWRKYMTEAGA